MSLHEFDIIRQYFTRSPTHASVAKSIGDDCAIVSVANNKQLVMSMDTVVAGRHFPNSATPYQIATRALCTSLSDLAAMGAKPLWFTLGLTLPSVNEEWLQSFSEGLFVIADHYQVDLIGGDTTEGPLTITVQVHGEVDQDKAIVRSGSSDGDKVFVTGTLGNGAAALAILLGELTVDAVSGAFLTDRFYQPELPISAMQQLVGVANAAIDISDGLLADAAHIAQASHVSILFDIEKLPMAPAMNSVDAEHRIRWALSGGDDYQVLFTVSDHNLDKVNHMIQSSVLDATCIGRVVASNEPCVTCYLDGKPYRLSSDIRGYQHFAS